MPRRHEDWLAQAKQDLEAAKDSFATNHYEMARIEEGDPFVIEILEDGIALYEDDGIHGRLLAAAAEAKERLGLVRTEDGWRWGR
ncbi:MAG TPA: hypothetical protein EYP09_09195 [Anaerolineae bacterium]|nr:hypothetical protein [Anaerolineae bacterium]